MIDILLSHFNNESTFDKYLLKFPHEEAKKQEWETGRSIMAEEKVVTLIHVDLVQQISK